TVSLPDALPSCTGGLEVLGLQVSDEEAVVGEEEGVVVPAGGRERLAHPGPHGGMTCAVLVEPVRADSEKEADASHRSTAPRGRAGGPGIRSRSRRCCRRRRRWACRG